MNLIVQLKLTTVSITLHLYLTQPLSLSLFIHTYSITVSQCLYQTLSLVFRTNLYRMEQGNR